jgi:ATP-binding cassette, subfamily B, bacterial
MSIMDFEEEDYKSKLTAPVFKRIAEVMKPHKKTVLGFLFFIGLTSIIEAYFTFLNKQIIDQGIIQSNVEALWRIGKIYGGVLIILSGSVFSFIYLAGILGERVQYDLRKMLFNHLQELSLSYYSQNAVGRLIARVTSDTVRVSDLVTWGILDFTWGIMNIMTASVFMLIINWKLGLIVMLILPILVFVAIKFREKIIEEYRLSRKVNSKITGAYNENIQGVRIVKALRREKENLGEFEELSSEMYRASYRAAWLSALFLPTVQIISSITLGFIVSYGGIQSQYGFITLGGIQAFVGYLTFMLWPIQDLARVYASMQNSVASAERIFHLIDTKPDIQNADNAIAVKTLLGDIIFNHVDFYYEDRVSILKDFNLTVRAGETIALVGPTGGGKSTIVNLLCRFYEPSSGSIEINGADYKNYTLDSIHNKLGIVLQTPHLFSGSIMQNIRYGKLSSTDEEIYAASKLAGADSFIQQLPKKYEDQVGEGGNQLSMGQKQLISLARAILSKPELFIMDEATSSVDTLTEALIQQGMGNIMKNSTSFVIAHRLSTIRNADKILVIEGGKITESGSHSELLKQKGHYFRLYTQQYRQELESQYGVDEGIHNQISS